MKTKAGLTVFLYLVRELAPLFVAVEATKHMLLPRLYFCFSSAKNRPTTVESDILTLVLIEAKGNLPYQSRAQWPESMRTG